MLLVVAVAYVIPPRLILPAYALVHAAYVGALLGGEFDARFRLASLTDGTLGVMFAAAVSWLLHRAKWNDFLKERTIAAQNRELGRRNAEMKELMAIAAHDLRSPLQGLDNVLELAGGLVDPAAARLRQALGEGRESCRRMLSLVTRLLDAHAAEHQRGGAARCDAAAAFGAAVQRHRAAAEARGVTLRGVLPSGPAPVAIGAEALAQVLDNLIGNALKFAPAGSVVEVALMAVADGWAGEVRDEGPGVPAEEQVELFGKFRRGANTPAGGEAGFGLGLFIVRQLLVSSGGEVSYADRAPRGAIFRVTLPQVS
jgi:signal transduction histidine kinase